MPNLALTRITGTPYTGKAYRNIPGSTTFTEETLPGSVKATNRLPSIIRFRDQVEMVAGMFDRVLIRDIREQAWFRSGIEAPPEAPDVELTTGSPGVTGSMLCYLQFLHKIGDRIIHQGNLSLPASLSPASQAITWTLPTIAPDVDRVTHISGWRAVDGNLPRRAWTLPLGTTSITEEVSGDTLNASATVPLRGTKHDLNARGVWPNVQWLETYHNAVFGAGDLQHKERLYYTRLYEPESVDPTLNGTWFATENGEPIAGIARFQDELIVGAWPRGFYSVQGYGPRSWRMRKINDYYQLLTHFSMRRVGPEGYLWMLTNHGPVAYVGGGRFIELADDFYESIRDDIRTNIETYRGAIAYPDDYQRVWKCLLPQANTTSYYIKGEYRRVSKGGLPAWYSDIRVRQDTVLGQFYTSSDGLLSSVVGSCDGHVRQENVADDADDDGDTYAKAMDVIFRHEVAGDQGGDDAHGRTWQGVDLFLKNQNTDVTLQTYAGDDTAPDASNPSETHTLKKSSQLEEELYEGRVPRTSRFVKLDETAGKGCTVRLTATSPVGVEVRGYALHYEETGEQVNPEE